MQGESQSQRLERCRQAVADRPESAVAHYNLGLAYTQQGMASRAEEAYRRAVELDPDLVEAWVNLGGSCLLQWDFEEARRAAEEAIKRRDDLALAHYNLGQACLYLGDAEAVVRCNEKVIELEPEHAAAHYYRAVGLLATNRVKEARETLSRATALGHRPPVEFLRGLEHAERSLDREQSNTPGGLGDEAAAQVRKD